MNVFHQYLPHEIDILLLSRQNDVIHEQRQEKNLADDRKQASPSLLLFPIQFPRKLFQIAFSTVKQQVSDHKDYAQREQPVLQCWTMIWATCVVVDVSRCLDTRTEEFSKIMERPPF